MSRMDLFKDALTSAVDRAARSFDETLESQLSEGRQRIADTAESLRHELTGALLEDSAFQELIAPAPAPPPATNAGAAGTILDAASKIDEAGDQGSVLVALLEGARAYCGRSLFILAQADGLEIWSGDGFGDDDSLVGKALGYDSSPWRRLRNASGVVHLDADDCRAAASDLGTDAADEAICVPFTLRDRLGGFVYADRSGDDARLDSSALRLLTHVAALSLETLAIRSQGVSPTLRDDADDQDALPLYLASGADEAAVADSAPETVTDDARPNADESESAFGGDPADSGTADHGEADHGEADDAMVENAATMAVTAVDLPAESADDDDDLGTVADVPATTVRPPAEELFGEETVTEQIQVDASFPNISADREVRTEVERDGDTLELEPIDPALMPGPDREHASSAASDSTVETGEFELDDPRFAKTAEPESAEPEAAGGMPAQEAGDAGISEDQTVMSQRGAVYRPPAQPAADAPSPNDSGEPSRKGTQVEPPSDLSGPGSAFLAGGSDGDEALREEARRLARLLVSEIKLYNEDRLEEGRREGSIYKRLKEDIDRSRKMYHERIDPRLEDADTFFYQELVDRLAGGNADLLGM